MPRTIACPHCRKILNVSRFAARQIVTCSRCDQSLAVPVDVAIVAAPVKTDLSNDFDFDTSKEPSVGRKTQRVVAHSTSALLLIALAPAVLLILTVAFGWGGWSIYKSYERERQRAQDDIAINHITDMTLLELETQWLQSDLNMIEKDKRDGVQITKERTQALDRKRASIADLRRSVSQWDSIARKRWGVPAATLDADFSMRNPTDAMRLRGF